MTRKGKLLDTMLLLTTNAFAGTYDRGGNPYILHCLKVMHYVNTNDEELQCIALGHDLLEDTSVTALMLYEQGFSERVVQGIQCLTKVEGESYEEYKIKVFSNKDAVLVKMADLRHNSDIRRLKGITEKDIQRMIKYHTFFLELQAIVNQK